ncbi:hypothetical protein JCM10908_002244 [Rhodotorula pacifica]|uniref:uncharacterized protein n=1 Tax=Rhodotorula pacifica TaxID=1495444 RepID=UPI00317C6790
MISPVKALSLLLLATASLVTAVPTAERIRPSESEERHYERRDACNQGGLMVYHQGSQFVCVGKTVFWTGAAIITVSVGTAAWLAYSVADMVTSRWHYGETAKTRLARRDDEFYISVGDTEYAVPANVVGDHQVVQITDYLAAAASKKGLAARDSADASLIGGQILYHMNGTLDTFTLDFGIADVNISNSTSSLAKRSYYTLHTTYWATSGHDNTNLNRDEIANLVKISYDHEQSGVSEACGYLANSGTWHGAFRHWTGDYGYTIGECDAERKY